MAFVEVTQLRRSTALRSVRTNSHNSHGSSSHFPLPIFPTPPRVGVVLLLFSISLSFFHCLAIDNHSSTRAFFTALFFARVQRLFLPSGYLPRWQTQFPIIVADCIPTSESMTVLQFQSLQHPPTATTVVTNRNIHSGAQYLIPQNSHSYCFQRFSFSGADPHLIPTGKNHLLTLSFQVSQFIHQ